MADRSRAKAQIKRDRQRRAYDLRMRGVKPLPRPPRLPKAPGRCTRQPDEVLIARALADKEARDAHNNHR